MTLGIQELLFKHLVMYNPLPHLPAKFQKAIKRLKSQKVPPKVILLAIGFLATLWFLVRVIPKPSRAAYPCMKATAPFMSAFVIYLLSLGGSIAAFRRFRLSISKSSYFIASLCLVGALVLFLFSVVQWPRISRASGKMPGVNYFTPNAPIGVAKGIFPGRVVWMWDTTSTNPACSNTSNENGVIDAGDDAWFMAKNSNSLVIDSMMMKSVLALTGTKDVTKAWDTLFRYFNINHGHGNMGYTAGQKILIKVNATTAWGGLSSGRFNADLGRTDHLAVNSFASETNPYVVLSVIRQLVNQAGIPEDMIYIGDPARNIYKEFYDLWHNEFPGVHVLGNNLIHTEIDITGLGRTPVVRTATDRVFWSDHGSVMPDAVTDKLFTLYDSIDYLINIPAMKAHSTGGITLAAKNHFGSFTREWAMHLHKGLFDNTDDPVRLGYGLYRVQVDIMEHKLLGLKTLVFIIDGLYPSDDAGGVPGKWQSPPFYNRWCSSLFMSLDPVAIESVCHDFLRTEYNGSTIASSRPNWYGVDDYLHQAADSSLWPAGITYDPDNDGVLIASLGVHEHWNDSLHKQYTRNLGTGFGIELYKAHETHTGIDVNPQALNVSVYPNPAAGFIHISNPSGKELKYRFTDISGRLRLQGNAGHVLTTIRLGDLENGLYLLKVYGSNSSIEFKVIKK